MVAEIAQCAVDEIASLTRQLRTLRDRLKQAA